MRGRRLRLPNLPSTLPADVLRDQFDFEPTWEERALDWHRQQLALALAEVKRIELEEQKAWLTTAMQRMAVIAVEIDEGLRKAALQEEWKGMRDGGQPCMSTRKPQTRDSWRDCKTNLTVESMRQWLLGLKKARKDMDRDTARLERLALLKRGVLRGTRKQFATGH